MIWEELTAQQRERIAVGDEAMKNLSRTTSIERWREVGDAYNELQAVAMRVTNTDKPVGARYNAEYGALLAHAPHLSVRDGNKNKDCIDKATKAHVMWLAREWETINAWRLTLPINLRMRLVHPTSIRRRYDTSHTTKEPGTVNPRMSLKDTATKLQETLDKRDAEISALKAGQYDIWPRGQSEEEFFKRISEIRNEDSLRKLAKVILREIKPDEPQTAKVSKPKRQRKPKAKLIQNDSARQEHDIEATGANETVATRE